MLIADFARASGLSLDAVNYYVRKGLFARGTPLEGERDMCLSFSEADLVTARSIRLSESFGFTLNEIVAINEARHQDRIVSQNGLEETFMLLSPARAEHQGLVHPASSLPSHDYSVGGSWH